MTDDDWKQKLTDEQYRVLRRKGTEEPFTGDLLHNKEPGDYSCAACGQKLFSSEHKFDSNSGWPSFYDVAVRENVGLVQDKSHGMMRVEVTCAGCGSHLGHVFNDAPKTPTGVRFCINSAALSFTRTDKKQV